MKLQDQNVCAFLNSNSYERWEIILHGVYTNLHFLQQMMRASVSFPFPYPMLSTLKFVNLIDEKWFFIAI